MQIQQKLAPFIWYQSGAEDAVAHYLKVFGAHHSRITHTQRWGENSPGAAGTVMLLNFELPDHCPRPPEKLPPSVLVAAAGPQASDHENEE